MKINYENSRRKSPKPLWFRTFLPRYLNRFALLVAGEGLEGRPPGYRFAPVAVVCRELSLRYTQLCSLALWMTPLDKTIINRFICTNPFPSIREGLRDVEGNLPYRVGQNPLLSVGRGLAPAALKTIIRFKK